jgi:hypothetical protein
MRVSWHEAKVADINYRLSDRILFGMMINHFGASSVTDDHAG